MKKGLFILLLLSTLSQAQNYIRQPEYYPSRNIHSSKDSMPQNTYFLSLHVGIALPLRDYASRDTTQNFMIVSPDSTHAKGFANLGFNFSASGGAFLNTHFGVVAKVILDYNSFSEGALNRMLSGHYYYIINGNFYMWQFMGGVFGFFGVNPDSWVWLQGMAGLIDANFPSFTLTYGYLDANFSLSNAVDFAYQLSIAYEKEIDNNIGFITTLSYAGAELSYPSLTYSSNFLLQSHTQNTPVTMPFGTFDLSIGVIFHL